LRILPNPIVVLLGYCLSLRNSKNILENAVSSEISLYFEIQDFSFEYLSHFGKVSVIIA
jgi:hypothetical protein